ncbi:hypothetical protein [Saccharomonospora iraqiensis]|uniref:hypothetical protein n=1 Tax=Saccharomonospora iraqiensis TaxID=52698 RepID=UPI00022E204D
MDVSAFLRQAEEYESVDDIRDSLAKVRNVELMGHPLAVVRAAQLQRWAASAEYRDILAGQYPRRHDDEPQSNWMRDLAGAARSYRDSFTTSTDPLVRVFSDVGEAMSGAADKVWSRFTGRDG